MNSDHEYNLEKKKFDTSFHMRRAKKKHWCKKLLRTRNTNTSGSANPKYEILIAGSQTMNEHQLILLI